MNFCWPRTWRVGAVVLAALLALPVTGMEPSTRAALPAGVVKLALPVRAGSPKVELTADGKLAVAASLRRNRAMEAVLFRFLLDGRPDPAFGAGGMVATRADGSHLGITSLSIESLAVQPDGKFVAAGQSATNEMYSTDFLVMRFLADGRPDPSFNGRGWTSTPIGSTHDQARAVTVLPDGAIVAAGGTLQRYAVVSARYDFALVRYLPDGRLDPGFGRNGRAVFRIGTVSEDFAYAVQADGRGRLLVAGKSHTRHAADLTLLRVDGNGTLDKGFGRKGRVVVRFGEAGSDGRALALQPDGRILVAGSLYRAATGGVLLRYDDAGRPDAAFGNAGVVRLPELSGVAVMRMLPDGRIVLLGTRGSTSGRWPAMVVIRLNPDGSPDPSFGTRGAVSIELGTQLTASGLAVSDMLEVFGCGTASHRFAEPGQRGDNGLVLFKLTAQGALDPSFGR